VHPFALDPLGDRLRLRSGGMAHRVARHPISFPFIRVIDRAKQQPALHGLPQQRAGRPVSDHPLQLQDLTSGQSTGREHSPLKHFGRTSQRWGVATPWLRTDICGRQE